MSDDITEALIWQHLSIFHLPKNENHYLPNTGITTIAEPELHCTTTTSYSNMRFTLIQIPFTTAKTNS